MSGHAWTGQHKPLSLCAWLSHAVHCRVQLPPRRASEVRHLHVRKALASQCTVPWLPHNFAAASAHSTQSTAARYTVHLYTSLHATSTQCVPQPAHVRSNPHTTLLATKPCTTRIPLGHHPPHHTRGRGAAETATQPIPVCAHNIGWAWAHLHLHPPERVPGQPRQKGTAHTCAPRSAGSALGRHMCQHSLLNADSIQHALPASVTGMRCCMVVC